MGVLTRRVGTWTESTSENLVMLMLGGAESMIMRIFIPSEQAMVCVYEYVQCDQYVLKLRFLRFNLFSWSCRSSYVCRWICMYNNVFNGCLEDVS